MQKLIWQIDNGIHNKGELIKTFGDSDRAIGNGIKYLEQVRELAIKLLPFEKQQIIDGHIAGQKFASDNDNPDSEEYFTETYGE